MLSEDLRYARVYYSNSDNWINISVPHNVFTNISGTTSTNSVTIVKDCPYWTFSRYTKDYKHMDLTALKFDAVRNEFKLMPGFFCDKVRGFEFLDMNDRLTLIVYEYDKYPFTKLMLNLFSLDGEEGCCVWTKMYTVGPFSPGSEVLQGFYSGEIVFHDHLDASRLRCFRYTPSLAFIEGMKSVFGLTTRTRRASVQYFRVPHGLINGLKH
ncbi:hypothetical protein ACET3Z_013918 [Daucus carota]